ncbi:MAG: hypothetical protein H0U86_05695 [Chloroflexi bacterium]|nr:hypothetical protein [Chloroflexota bacterium]
MDPSADAGPLPMRIGRSGRLEAAALEVAGDHAILVQETDAEGRRRVLLTTDKLATGERLVVMPLDDDVEVRVDGDALAVWLGSGVLGEVPREQIALSEVKVPPWASIVGGTLLIVVLAFAVIGSAVVFTWLSRLFA